MPADEAQVMRAQENRGQEIRGRESLGRESLGQEIAAQELGERLSRIRLPIKEMARRVKCDQATITSYTRGLRQMSERLQRDVSAELAREELDLLAHLVAVHPDQAAALVPQAKAA